MKYWWLEKYKNISKRDILKLQEDLEYFLIMPKDYSKTYLSIQNQEIDSLEEEQLLILLKILVSNIWDTKKIRRIIHKLLTISDNSFPTSDYTFSEILEEIFHLKENLPYMEKLEHNNVAICYHCLNIYYVDKITKVNSKGLCLCPYCHSTRLYFDNDYIPMNYSFLKLSYLYYHVSRLGCSFLEYRKIVKKNLKIKKIEEMDREELLSISPLLEKMTPISEKIIYKAIYDLLLNYNQLFYRKSCLFVPTLKKDATSKLILFFTCILEVLGNTMYLKDISLCFEDLENQKEFQQFIKDFLSMKVSI